jgi:hypothetical protein
MNVCVTISFVETHLIECTSGRFDTDVLMDLVGTVEGLCDGVRDDFGAGLDAEGDLFLMWGEREEGVENGKKKKKKKKRKKEEKKERENVRGKFFF